MINPGETIDLINEFPVNLFKSGEHEAVFNELKTMVKSNKVPTEEIDRDSDLKKSSMNKIFAIFLFSVGKFVKKEFYKELVFFVLMYRKALNEIGWFKKFEQTKVDDRAGEYCAANNGEFAPEISNDFITDKWPEYCQNYPVIKFKYLGPEVEPIRNTVFLTREFCNWLNNARYTNSRLNINEEGSGN
jgi:hypothetical protein